MRTESDMAPETEPKWIPYCGDPNCEHAFAVGPPGVCVKCGAMEKPAILEAKAWWPRENPTNDDILNAFRAGWKIGHGADYKNIQSRPVGVNTEGWNGDILFSVDGLDIPILALKSNGDIEVKGKKVENDKAVVEGFRAFLAGMGIRVKSEYDRDFGEDELAEMTERARRQALVPKNWLWVEAYKALSLAADRLHAMIRRSEEDAPAHTKDAI